MFIFRDEMKSSAYRTEITEALQQIIEVMPPYNELSFFIKSVRNHYLFDFDKNRPLIVVLGSNIPEELVYAAENMSYWVLGGSRVSSMWADDIVPRDTDPVSRSSLGYMMTGFAKSSLILIPLVSDSTRKLAYILKSMGLKVHTFHFPPVKDADSLAEWKRQYDSCRSAIGLQLKRTLTNRMVKKSKKQIQGALSRIRWGISLPQLLR